MNKIYRIIQYIQPWEIDDLSRQVHDMILSSYHIPSNATVIWDVTMNTDVVNWENSKLPIDYFISKFEYLKTIVDYYFTAEFNIDNNIKGCTDKRRNIVNTTQDYVIWLDSDIYFSKLNLPYLINATMHIEDELYMISPQIIKYWDDSWNCLVNSKFINEPYNHRDYFDLYSLNDVCENNNITIKQNTHIKFGGGWFNLFTNKIFEQIIFPIELGSYSADDLYIMLCASKLNVKQYILDGIVVSEIGNKYLHNKNYTKPLLDIKILDKQKISDDEFSQLIRKFYEEH
jgi:hypothetical protein